MAAPAPFIEIWRGRDGKWYGHRKARNGRVTGGAGQGYRGEGAVRKWAEKNHPDLHIKVVVKN